jgi:aspartate/methionine/tyrosine aminotransferase
LSADQSNAVLAAEAPAVWAALSDLGRRIYFPRDIPFQAAEARGVSYNGTIGQITDGRGNALRLSGLENALSGLGAGDRNTALLYSPMAGLPELRDRWRSWQRRGHEPKPPSTLPLVTVGMTHGVAVAADLFGGPGRAVAVPSPFWGNYRQIFATRGGARVLSAPLFHGHTFNAQAIEEALAREPEGEPAVAVLNFPANPGGYSPTSGERAALLASLHRVADSRPTVVLCDDAYEGLVHDDTLPRGSLFWDLAGSHPNLVAVKVDGATKEFAFFGGRVGFITFGFEPDSPSAAALEDKVLGLIRTSVGSPVTATQSLLLAAMRTGTAEQEIADLRARLTARHAVMMRALADLDEGVLAPLPCNAGCFTLAELPAGLEPEAVRRHLLAHQDTGVIAVSPRYLRLAFCSVSSEAIPELVRRTARGVGELLALQKGARLDGPPAPDRHEPQPSADAIAGAATAAKGT